MIHSWFTEQVALRRKNPDIVVNNRDQTAWEFLRDFADYVIFEDDHMLVINKPAGINSHFSDRNPVGVLEVVRLLRGNEVALAHRLDRDTTGVLVLAKTEESFDNLVEQFANKARSQMNKKYLAIVDGELDSKEVIRAEVPIVKSDTDKMRVTSDEEYRQNPEARNSLSFFKPQIVLVDSNEVAKTLTEVQIVTGRTHQIRVVSADFLQHPIVGDRLYNPEPWGSNRPMLHAFELTLRHPVTDELLIFTAPIPEDFKKLMSSLDWKYFFPQQEKARSQKKPEELPKPIKVSEDFPVLPPDKHQKIDRYVTKQEFNNWLLQRANERGGDLTAHIPGGESDQLLLEFMRNFESHILYEDPYILAVNKPAGMASNSNNEMPIGAMEIVQNARDYSVALANRLDNDTSGILLFAKNKSNLKKLEDQLEDASGKQTKKLYYALLEGEITTENIVSSTDGTSTSFRPLAIFSKSDGNMRTIVEVRIVSEGTNQIRMAAARNLQHPIVGDEVYDPNQSEVARRMLHFSELIFRHPVTKRIMSIQAPLPDDFQQLVSDMNTEYIFPEKEIVRTE